MTKKIVAVFICPWFSQFLASKYELKFLKYIYQKNLPEKEMPPFTPQKGSNSNSTFIVLNLHLKAGSRCTKQKKQNTIIIKMRQSKGQRHLEKLGKAQIRVDMLVYFRKELKTHTSLGISFHIIVAS